MTSPGPSTCSGFLPCWANAVDVDAKKATSSRYFRKVRMMVLMIHRLVSSVPPALQWHSRCQFSSYFSPLMPCSSVVPVGMDAGCTGMMGTSDAGVDTSGDFDGFTSVAADAGVAGAPAL